jgi:NAD(P)-dependent dehydrogenase (short-subunit alcohol dehydrogenase family)
MSVAAPRVALVTGAGSGIGRATALAFATAGTAVMLADNNAATGEETLHLVREQGGEAEFRQVDVALNAEVAGLVAATVERFGRLDWAFNNAGIEGVITSVVEYPEEMFDRVIDVNVKGVWLCMRHEIPVMLGQGGGAIVNTASVAGLAGNPHVIAYTASKHAVIGLTRSAALGYAARNIRVNAICPGIIDTPMIERLTGEFFPHERLVTHQPIGRMGRPEEVAAAVVWLCSAAASLVTGIAMAIAGGGVACRGRSAPWVASVRTLKANAVTGWHGLPGGCLMETLAEDLLLLALDDDRGSVSWQRADAVKYGLGGALLMELALQQRIDIVEKRITLSDRPPTGDELLDAALESIRAEKKPRDAKHWVVKLGDRKGLREDLARRLVARGILREQEHTFLWVFHEQRFPTSDPGPEAVVRGRLRDVVLAGEEPDTRTLLLLSLVNGCGLADSLFAKDERKQARRRVKELVEGEQFGKAVSGAVSDAAAMVAAVAASTSVAATAAHSS